MHTFAAVDSDFETLYRNYITPTLQLARPGVSVFKFRDLDAIFAATLATTAVQTLSTLRDVNTPCRRTCQNLVCSKKSASSRKRGGL